MDPELVASQYAKIRAAFAAHGCDWVILSPHYVRPGPVESWMGDGFDQVISVFSTQMSGLVFVCARVT